MKRGPPSATSKASPVLQLTQRRHHHARWSVPLFKSPRISRDCFAVRWPLGPGKTMPWLDSCSSGAGPFPDPHYRDLGYASALLTCLADRGGKRAHRVGQGGHDSPLVFAVVPPAIQSVVTPRLLCERRCHSPGRIPPEPTWRVAEREVERTHPSRSLSAIYEDVRELGRTELWPLG